MPLIVAVPFLAAPLLTLVGEWVPKRTPDVVGIAAAATSFVLSLVVLARTVHAPFVYWFGGWRPRGNVALGISFSVDQLGAGLAALSAFLVLSTLVYSWRYFEEVGTLFHVLTLLFLGAMCGFALTGDVFNMFVWFELMSTAAFALCGYKVEEAGSLQGAFNFAVTNSIGAFLVLFGIGLLYGRTGALNLAQIGRSIGATHPDGLVVAAFVLVTCGFLVKAAAVPFHFWLADAHAVAPAPICVLFSGVMVELGIYAVARIYWTVFAQSFAAHEPSLRTLLVGLGILTGAVGAVMAFMQRHVKRLLAYSTIAHMGLFIVGVGLLTPDGIAGAAMYVLAHGLAKGALFLMGGILLERLRAIDELRLYGRAKGGALALVGVTWLLAAVALADPPFVGTWAGHALIEDSAAALGHGWIAPVMTAITIVSTGAILRCGARIFLGWGPRADPLLSPQPPEEPSGTPRRGSAALLVAPALVLTVLALAAGAIPPLSTHAQQAAERFVNHRDSASHVLEARPPEAVPLPRHITTSSGVVWGLVATLGSFAFAAWGLWRPRFPSLSVPVEALRAVHSGHVGDYVAWLTLGVAVFGGLVALGVT